MVFAVRMALCLKYVQAKDAQRGNRTVCEKMGQTGRHFSELSLSILNVSICHCLMFCYPSYWRL